MSGAPLFVLQSMDPRLAEVAPLTEDDRALWERYRRGDVESLVAIYRRHGRPLHVYALALTRDPAEAEDLVQHAFLRLIDGPTPASVQAFLYAVVRNRAVDIARRAAVHRRAVALLGGPAGTDTDPDLADTVSRALDEIPEEQREAVILKVYADLTFEEIGEVTGLPAPTIMSRYRYGLQKLAALLDSLRGDA